MASSLDNAPEQSHGKPWVLSKSIEKSGYQDFTHFNFCYGFDVVIRRVKQNTSYPQKIARYLEINDLSGSVSLNFVGADPAAHQDEGRLI